MPLMKLFQNKNFWANMTGIGSGLFWARTMKHFVYRLPVLDRLPHAARHHLGDVASALSGYYLAGWATRRFSWSQDYTQNVMVGSLMSTVVDYINTGADRLANSVAGMFKAAPVAIPGPLSGLGRYGIGRYGNESEERAIGRYGNESEERAIGRLNRVRPLPEEEQEVRAIAGLGEGPTYAQAVETETYGVEGLARYGNESEERAIGNAELPEDQFLGHTEPPEDQFSGISSVFGGGGSTPF